MRAAVWMFLWRSPPVSVLAAVGLRWGVVCLFSVSSRWSDEWMNVLKVALCAADVTVFVFQPREATEEELLLAHMWVIPDVLCQINQLHLCSVLLSCVLTFPQADGVFNQVAADVRRAQCLIHVMRESELHESWKHVAVRIQPGILTATLQWPQISRSSCLNVFIYKNDI